MQEHAENENGNAAKFLQNPDSFVLRLFFTLTYIAGQLAKGGASPDRVARGQLTLTYSRKLRMILIGTQPAILSGAPDGRYYSSTGQ
ncbi:hypothetical protein TRICHSKD4_5202 [Roseibium sp. TrichSKD4]|nr:hypothetical protein TRICHSKD4_5202 [Roseibium sp. TrichSKD4]